LSIVLGMKSRFVIFTLLFFCQFKITAQDNPDAKFEAFAKVQDSLMVKAYEQKDVKTYHKLLDVFLDKYNKLSKEDKAYFLKYCADVYYNLCCTYALLNDKPHALEYFEKSIKSGYMDYGHITVDTDLNLIREDAKFKALSQTIRETGDYLYILKKAGKYNTEEKRVLPAFTYQSADNPHLTALRKAFNLDSIAGRGNEVNQIINLMDWIHNLVPHDGEHGNPEVKNAMAMIAFCKKEKRGLNCRGLATVLNECYLAMGFKSRFITCLPKDSLGTDNDCHVINMVWCTELKKWLWIDPTNDAYVMNEQGIPLSVEEVRERIITDKPLLLNPNANWNRRGTQTKEEYLYHYMAKNLYMIEAPSKSEYDTETKQKGKEVDYLRLVPLDYFNKSLDKSVQEDEAKTIKFNNYKTNNPAVFWKAQKSE